MRFILQLLFCASVAHAQTFRDCPTCPEMVCIPAGVFFIGSPADEPGHLSNPETGPSEGPQRVVHIRWFAAGKFDITRGQWAEFVADTKRPTTGGCAWAHLPGDTGKPWVNNPTASWNHLGFEQDDDHPVVCVSWDDAQDYVKWLSRRTGKHYRLLTEAEWEYAARGESTTPYPWGSIASHEYANYGSDSVDATGAASGRDRWDYSTSPVGAFPPNPFGLYDMHGNVMQWVEDCFSFDYTLLPTDGTAYKQTKDLNFTGNLSWLAGKNSADFHMTRGGCFGDSGSRIRSASRNFGAIPTAFPDYCRTAGGGFRVARTL